MRQRQANPGPQTQPREVGIVLAAGSARRFGATKQLELLHGRPLVRHATGLLRAAGLERILVVTGKDAEAVARAAGPHVVTVWNPEYAQGQSTSVQSGLLAARELQPAVDVVVIVPADQPDLSSDLVRAVLRASRRTGRPARARYTDAAGPPVALPRSCWADVLQQMVGDAGAGRILGSLGVVEVDVDAPMPTDVDRVRDLEAMRRRPRSQDHDDDPGGGSDRLARP